MSSSSSDTPSMPPGTLVNKRFRIDRKIGSGSFGEIFVAYDTFRDTEVAVKVEVKASKHPQIHYEAKIYKILAGGRGTGNIVLLWGPRHAHVVL